MSRLFQKRTVLRLSNPKWPTLLSCRKSQTFPPQTMCLSMADRPQKPKAQRPRTFQMIDMPEPELKSRINPKAKTKRSSRERQVSHMVATVKHQRKCSRRPLDSTQRSSYSCHRSLLAPLPSPPTR